MRPAVYVVDNEVAAQQLLQRLRTLPGQFGVDCETEGCDPRKQSPAYTARIVCWSVAWFEADAAPHPVAVETKVASRAFIWAEYLPLFKGWLGDAAVHKVGANFSAYDMHCFENHGCPVAGLVHDNKHSSRLWYSSKDVAHDLKSQAEGILGASVAPYGALFSRAVELKGKAYKADRYYPRGTSRTGPLAGVPTLVAAGRVATFSQKERQLIPLSTIRADYPDRVATLVEYASNDAAWSLELMPFREAQLASRPAKGRSTLGLYRDVWNPMLLMLQRIERTGMLVDAAECTPRAAAAQADIDALLPALHGWAGTSEFNPGSHDQVRALLCDQLRLPRPPIQGSMKAVKPVKPTDAYPTSQVSLYWLELHCPEYRQQLGELREYRKAKKMHQYLRDLPKFIAADGRVHTVLSPEADSGRLSAKLPALQQIPAKDKYGVRNAFIAAPGHKLVVCDMSQLEVYVLAHVLLRQFNDSSVYDALRSGDVYGSIAKLSWPSRTQQVEATAFKHHADPAMRKLRDLAKVQVLAANYCMSPQSMALQLLDGLGEPAEEQFCIDLQAKYMRSFPGIRKYQKWTADYATQHGGIGTLLGRWRPLPEARSERRWEAARAHRQAANSPIQGSASDVVVMAMLGLCSFEGIPGWYCPELAATGAKCIIQVHDELVFEVPTDRAEDAMAIIVRGMENPPGLDLAVQLRADAVVCDSWGGAKS